jgi:L-aminopeptidase/D-esterase-like protein
VSCRCAQGAIAFLLGFVFVPSTPSILGQSSMGGERPGGITAVPGIQVGHYTLARRPTGCTVVLALEGAVAGADVRGGAPATRETDLLRPENLVERVHAVVFAGGSAFGLDAASGVVQALAERDVGFPVTTGVVPIVVGAALFDLGVGADPTIRPDAACGRAAVAAASTGAVAEGNVGAGAGATVGKLWGLAHAMKGGVGSSAIELPSGLVVGALAAVNAVGDVIDPATGEVVAGVRDGERLLDARRLLREGRRQPPEGARPAMVREHTTLVVVATNAVLSKSAATRVAQMANAGVARTLYPAHSPYDGDVLFVLATGRLAGEADVLEIGALAASAVADATVRAVRAADPLPGLPSARGAVP